MKVKCWIAVNKKIQQILRVAPEYTYGTVYFTKQAYKWELTGSKSKYVKIIKAEIDI